jgi:hypothetical protein
MVAREHRRRASVSQVRAGTRTLFPARRHRRAKKECQRLDRRHRLDPGEPRPRHAKLRSGGGRRLAIGLRQQAAAQAPAPEESGAVVQGCRRSGAGRTPQMRALLCRGEPRRGWSLAVQESLAHGTPCIASDHGGTREAGLGLAYYVDRDASDGLVRALRTYLADDVLQRARQAIRARLERAQPCQPGGTR